MRTVVFLDLDMIARGSEKFACYLHLEGHVGEVQLFDVYSIKDATKQARERGYSPTHWCVIKGDKGKIEKIL